MASDPLAAVDEPIDTAGVAESLAFGEVEALVAREAILRECIGVTEAARRIRRSRQSVERLRRAGRLLALRVGPKWRYPQWQFEPESGGVISGLEEVLRQLSLSPTGAAIWLLQPSERLGGQPPIKLLRRQPKQILELAREHSFLP